MLVDLRPDEAADKVPGREVEVGGATMTPFVPLTEVVLTHPGAVGTACGGGTVNGQRVGGICCCDSGGNSV